MAGVSNAPLSNASLVILLLTAVWLGSRPLVLLPLVDRCLMSSGQTQSSAIERLLLLSAQKSGFRKFKMADGRHLGFRFSAIISMSINIFAPNLVQ